MFKAGNTLSGVACLFTSKILLFFLNNFFTNSKNCIIIQLSGVLHLKKVVKLWKNLKKDMVCQPRYVWL